MAIFKADIASAILLQIRKIQKTRGIHVSEETKGVTKSHISKKDKK
jgi:hypothetical protein